MCRLLHAVVSMVGAALLPAPAFPAQEPPASLDDREVQECRNNLSLVFEAIQAYRRVHKDIPNSLRELQPAFLAEDRFLICPAARRLGITSADATKWGASEPGSYGYEFSPVPIPRVMSGGSSRTLREWKRLQMGLLGSEVPIVRCQTHERAVLNLSFGGRIYESKALEWEEEFRALVDPRELTQARRLATHLVTKKIVVPRRDPRAARAQIDLGAHYNLLLDEPWWPDDASPGPLARLPRGSVSFHGTAFDVRGAIQLGAIRPGLIHYPSAVTNILLESPARSVHLLVGTAGEAVPGSLVATCVFHMADGRQQRLHLLYARHLAASVSSSRETFGPLPDGSMAWTAELPGGRTARLFHCLWTNPSPGQLIRHMDFVGAKGSTGPLLVALSVEPEP